MSDLYVRKKKSQNFLKLFFFESLDVFQIPWDSDKCCKYES